MKALTFVVLAIGLGACNSSGREEQGPAKRTVASTASTQTTAMSATGSASVSSVVAVETGKALAVLEAYADSPRPTKEMWADAPDLPEATGPRFRRCTLKRIREWVRAECGQGLWFTPSSNMGKSGTDYFYEYMSGVVEFRVRPGDAARGSLSQQGINAKLFVAWPSDEPAPTVATLRQITPDNPGFLELSAPQPIPSMTAGAAPKPLPGDWAKGVQVNSAAEAERPPLCDLRVLRGWLRLRCGAPGSIPTMKSGEALGVRDKDFFMLSQVDTLELTVRLEPGAVRTAKLWLNEIHADLKVEWPQGADAPSEVSLAVVR